MDFCPDTLMLLSEITSEDKLMFKSDKTGNKYEATDENTMLVSESSSELQSISKFKQTLNVTAYTAVNPRSREDCQSCGRKIISFQRLGDENRVVFVCLCGNTWSV